MQQLDKLDFGMVRDAYPERYGRSTVAAASIRERGPGQFVVKFPDSEEAHPVALARAPAGHYGTCECKGYEHHPGPCSHLCLLNRAESAGVVETAYAEPEHITAELRSKDQERADSEHGMVRTITGP